MPCATVSPNGSERGDHAQASTHVKDLVANVQLELARPMDAQGAEASVGSRTQLVLHLGRPTHRLGLAL